MMRKLLLILGLFLTGMVSAQNYTRDAGIRVGDFFTASLRQYREDDKAVEGMVFIGRRGATFTIMNELFEPALGHISDHLYFLYGYGMHIGYRYTDHYHVFDRVYDLQEYKFTPLLGLDGIIGIEYRFPEFPFLISIDFKPYFEYSTIQIFSVYLQSAGISLKYRF